MNYWHDLRRAYPAFVRNRFLPYAGSSAIFALAAYKGEAVLAATAYLIATLVLPATVAALSLAAAGNRVASARDADPVCRAVLGLACGLAGLTWVATTALILGGAPRFLALGAWGAAWVYLPALPLLVVNTAMLALHEATGAAAQCARTLRVALMAALACAGLAYFLVPASRALLWVTGYFLLYELLVLAGLVWLARRRGLSWQPVFDARQWQGLWRLGWPVAAGVGLQKLYFALLNQDFRAVSVALLGQWSLAFTAIGLLILPALALSQWLSLRRSQGKMLAGDGARAALTWLLLAAAGLPVWLLLGPWIMLGLGAGSMLPWSMAGGGVLALVAAVNGVVALCLGQLRALHDTFVPQLIYGAALLAGWGWVAHDMAGRGVADLQAYLLVHAAVLALVAAGLALRCARLARRRPGVRALLNG